MTEASQPILLRLDSLVSDLDDCDGLELLLTRLAHVSPVLDQLRSTELQPEQRARLRESLVRLLDCLSRAERRLGSARRSLALELRELAAQQEWITASRQIT